MKFEQKKILFFHNTEWVMGKIHYELARVLYPHVNADVACGHDQFVKHAC